MVNLLVVNEILLRHFIINILVYFSIDPTVNAVDCKPYARYESSKHEYGKGLLQDQGVNHVYKDPSLRNHHYTSSSQYIKPEPDYQDYPAVERQQEYSEDQQRDLGYTDRQMVDSMMYNPDSLSRLSHSQDQLAKYNTDSLSRLSGLSSAAEGLSRLQAQDSLARISSMTNSISPPQSSSHSSLSPGTSLSSLLTFTKIKNISLPLHRKNLDHGI